MAKRVEKVLYMVVYHIGLREINEKTTQYLTFFYAADQEEAHRKVAEKKQKMLTNMWVEAVEKCSQSFIIRQSAMPGKITIGDAVHTQRGSQMLGADFKESSG